MHRHPLLKALEHYAVTMALPEEQETVQQFYDFVLQNSDCFERARQGHVTSSAWIMSHDGSHALMTHHKKLNAWFQLGGHNDGDADCAAVALKEGYEESGIETLKLVSGHILDIDIHPLPNACTYHYDVRYLLQAPEGAKYVVSEESINLAWVPAVKLSNYSQQRSVVRMHEKWERLYNLSI